MRLREINLALREMDFGTLFAVAVAARRELGRRYEDFAEDPDTLRKDAAGWPDNLVQTLAKVADERAGEHEPWEHGADFWREIADVLLAEALSREEDAP